MGIFGEPPCTWGQNTWSRGYDHLLFLVGVIFFLYRLKDIARGVSLFTLGTAVRCCWAFLGHVRTNPYLIDAVIALSLVYKGLQPSCPK